VWCQLRELCLNDTWGAAALEELDSTQQQEDSFVSSDDFSSEDFQ
jgi:hypothetical protein